MAFSACSRLAGISSCIDVMKRRIETIEETGKNTKNKTHLGQDVLLVGEQHLGLLGVAQKHLQVERLREELLAVLPHLVQLLPAVAQRLEPLAQEHVLRVVGRGLLAGDALAVVHHARVVVPVVLDLLLDALVLAEQLLGLGERAGDVLGGHVRLRLGEPRLEVVEVAQEAVQVAGLLELRVALLEHLREALPHGADLLEPLADHGLLVGVLGPDLLCLLVERVELRLDGGQVALHAGQAPLQGHDAAQVHLEAVGRLQDADLVLDPQHRLAALDVERLHAVRRLQLVALRLGPVAQLRPAGVQLVLAGHDVVRVGVLDVQQLPGELVHDGHARRVRVHLALEPVVPVPHHLHVLDVLGGHHRLEHALLLADPLLHAVRLGEQLVQGQGVEEALFAQFGEFQELLWRDK